MRKSPWYQVPGALGTQYQARKSPWYNQVPDTLGDLRTSMLPLSGNHYYGDVGRESRWEILLKGNEFKASRGEWFSLPQKGCRDERLCRCAISVFITRSSPFHFLPFLPPPLSSTCEAGEEYETTTLRARKRKSTLCDQHTMKDEQSKADTPVPQSRLHCQSLHPQLAPLLLATQPSPTCTALPSRAHPDLKQDR